MDPASNPSEKTRKYVENSVLSYIWEEPYCTLKWIRRTIRESEIRPGDLKKVFRNLLKDYGNNKRYRLLFDICRKADFDAYYVN
jgi:hypothetical protein